MDHRTSVYMHYCMYQSLWWTSELWLSVAYHILFCWRNSYMQNAGGILTVLERLKFPVLVTISRQSHTTSEPVYVRLAVGLENHTECYTVCVLSVCLQLPLPISQQLRGRLLNGSLLLLSELTVIQ